MIPTTTDKEAFTQELTELCNRYKVKLMALQYKILILSSDGGEFRRRCDESLNDEWVDWIDDNFPEL